MSGAEFGAGVAIASLGLVGVARTWPYLGAPRAGAWLAQASALLGIGAGLIFASLH